MKFLNTGLSPLGLGCWPIGGEMFAHDGQSLGYSNSNDAESIRAIHAALANGITLFDTAAAYGAGHSERLLAKALGNNSEAQIVTKIGIGIDESTKTLLGEEITPESIMPAINRCLGRLEKSTVDLMLLHPNNIPLDQAHDVFDEMEKARESGKIRAFGWSTDFVVNADTMKDRAGFQAIEHAMNVFMDAPDMQGLVHQNDLAALIRSPLAMGLLSGKYSSGSTLPINDIRATNQGWAKYYIDGSPNPDFTSRYDAIRELLQTDGRSPVQGALAWLWAKSPNNIPVPGARTVEQVEGLAAALAYGPLPQNIMTEIDTLVGDETQCDGASPR